MFITGGPDRRIKDPNLRRKSYFMIAMLVIFV